MSNLIQWTKGAKYWDSAFNPVVGCVPVSDGCKNCYASEICKRFDMNGDGGFTPTIKPNAKPAKTGVVFVGNMTDIFGEWNSDFWVIHWDALAMSPVANLFLTKRADRLAVLANRLQGQNRKTTFYGITAENQARLEERLGALFLFKRRWLSLEPLLGLINFREAMAIVNDIGDDFTKTVDWVVVGAESGLNRRPCKIEWVESVVGQCLHYEIPVFVKQLDINGELVKDIRKFPTHLQIRQVPWGGGIG